MAATFSAYKTEKFNTITSSNTLVQHSLAIPTTDFTTTKDRFYLDEVFQVNVSGSTPSFVGGCVNGSTNFNYHNTSRIGSLRSRNSSGIVVYYTDAGLNTLGDLTSPICTNKQSGLHNFQGFFKSAYYVATNDHQIQVKRVGDANWKHVFFGTMAANTSATKNSTPDNTVFDFDAGDVIDMFSIIINDEGTKQSIMVQFIVEPREYIFTFNSTYASYACNNTNGSTQKTVFVSNWKLNLGDILYKDILRDDIADIGYYAINGEWYKTTYDLGTNKTTIVDLDVCGTWRNNDPAYVPPYIIKVWDHYENLIQGSSEGCFKYANGATLTPKTTYQSTVNNKYYTSTSAATTAGTIGFTVDGFYFEISVGIMTWIKIESGVVSDSGTC